MASHRAITSCLIHYRNETQTIPSPSRCGHRAIDHLPSCSFQSDKRSLAFDDGLNYKTIGNSRTPQWQLVHHGNDLIYIGAERQATSSKPQILRAPGKDSQSSSVTSEISKPYGILQNFEMGQQTIDFDVDGSSYSSSGWSAHDTAVTSTNCTPDWGL